MYFAVIVAVKLSKNCKSAGSRRAAKPDFLRTFPENSKTATIRLKTSAIHAGFF